MTIRLFASDMDGTLLNEKHFISEETAKAIKALQQTDIEFIIATGRGYDSAKFLLDQHDIQCRIIGLNGATMHDVDGTLMDTNPIAPTLVKKVIHYLDAHQLEYGFQTEDGYYTSDIERFKARLSEFSGSNSDITTAQLVQLLGTIHTLDAYDTEMAQPILKFMVFSKHAEELAAFTQQFESYEHLDITSSNYDNLEITSSLAQKGLALERYAFSKGYTMENVLAIGDSPNDRSMLKMATYSYAMQNASDYIKQLARHQAPANTENGVAHVIWQLLNQPQ